MNDRPVTALHYDHLRIGRRPERRARCTGTRRIVSALCLVLLSACAGPGSIPLGTYETVISGASPELDGTWALTLEPKGRFRIALDGQPAVTGSYAYEGDRITFTDESGPMMCAAGITRGRYLWKLEGAELRLLAVEDECAGRRGILARQPHRLKSGQ